MSMDGYHNYHCNIEFKNEKIVHFHFCPQASVPWYSTNPFTFQGGLQKIQ